MDHCAVFHKSCISNYNKQKLLRKHKLEDMFSSSTDDICQDTEELSETIHKWTTRHSLTLLNFQSSCFFCDQVDDQKNLHECQTIATSSRVNEIAVELSDTKLIAKLSEGDMIATATGVCKFQRIRFF